MPETTDTKADHMPDPVKCPECGQWVRPFMDDYGDHRAMTCPKCGYCEGDFLCHDN